MESTKTERGFGLVEFKDRNQVECSLQQSSAIDLNSDDGIAHPGSSFIWLGCNSADPQYFIPNGDPSWRPVPMPAEYIANTRMHLGREEVQMLIEHLTNWLNTGQFVDDVLSADHVSMSP